MLPMTLPVVEVITIRRTRQGQSRPDDACISFWPGGALSIDTRWDGDTWKVRRDYRVSRQPTDWAGRSFAVAKQDGGPPETYNVFIADDGRPHDVCDCRGYQSHGHCVHSDALRFLAEKGHA